MYEEGIRMSDFKFKLSQGFKERKAFDVTYGSTAFNHDNV